MFWSFLDHLQANIFQYEVNRYAVYIMGSHTVEKIEPIHFDVQVTVHRDKFL